MDGTAAGHMTSEEAGRVANMAKVGKLILTHLPHYGNLNQLKTEAGEQYRGTFSSPKKDSLFRYKIGKEGKEKMLFIDNNGITDPRINLAIEEYALKHLDADNTYLLFYINEPSIIIGKNQNTIEEINTEYVEKTVFMSSAGYPEEEPFTTISAI